MSSEGSTRKYLDELFPPPSLPPSQFCPQRLPGADLQSLAALQHVLRDNHERYHIFLNQMRFHNHITHRALAVYALGGPANVIRDYYERDRHNQRLAFESPESITVNNFVDHLGDESFYRAYVRFFSEQISEKGTANILEEFVFSEEYNFREGRDEETQPAMFNRFLSGLFHSLIHVGYGAEFGLEGMIVEGLALAAVHNKEFHPPSLFTPSLALETSGINVTPASKTGGVHAFDIVAYILKDDKFKFKAPAKSPADFMKDFKSILTKLSAGVMEHAERWTIDLAQPGEIQRKMEELIWVTSLVYGVGGSTHDGFQADFFLMHLVTSSLFLPPLIAYLSPRSQVLLLRGYLTTVLTVWVMRGRPALNIKFFMTSTSVEPSIPNASEPKTPLSTETTPIPNPFLPTLQSAIPHPDDHFVKIQRTFAHFDTLYGRRRAGYFKGTALEGAELLDGSLFLRTALLTADYIGWVREGGERRPFDFKGFYA